MNEFPVYTIELPNPFLEGRNRVYVIGSDPLTMIDTGVATQRSFDRLVDGFKEHALSLDRVGRVILTHKHIDHVGNAWRIQQLTGAEVHIHESELESITDVDPDGTRFAALVSERLREWNVSKEALPQSEASSKLRWEIEPAQGAGLVDGQQISLGTSQLEVIHTPGHTMGSICLRYGHYLFSGDHVLPDISPNIGGGDMRKRGLLRHYLAALERIRNVDDGNLQVMPGHGEPFTGLAQRCDQLVVHHKQRLEQVVNILADGPGQTVYEVATKLFGDLEQFHVVLGCAEAAAHLEYLEEDSRVVAENGRYRRS